MSGKARRTARLVAIRRLGEEDDRRTLAGALASVAEVETTLARQEMALTDARMATRRALEVGDRGAWLMADAQGEVAQWNRERLGVLLKERAAAVAPAMEKFLASRREHEQAKHLAEGAQQAAAIEEGRKAQAASDDWFLSRRMRSAR